QRQLLLLRRALLGLRGRPLARQLLVQRPVARGRPGLRAGLPVASAGALLPPSPGVFPRLAPRCRAALERALGPGLARAPRGLGPSRSTLAHRRGAAADLPAPVLGQPLPASRRASAAAFAQLPLRAARGGRARALQAGRP